MLEDNFRNKIASSPDFKGMPYEEAMKDLRLRIEKYEAAYESVRDDTLSYIKLYNLSSKVSCNKIYGRMACQLTPFLMAINIGTRPIYLVRAGSSGYDLPPDESEASSGGAAQERSSPRSPRIARVGSGKVANLKEEGVAFSETLANWTKDRCMQWMENNGISCPALRLARAKRVPSFAPNSTQEGGDRPFDLPNSTSVQGLGIEEYRYPHDQPLMKIFTSTLPRAQNTVKPLGLPFTPTPQLNPLDKGELSQWNIADVLTHRPDIVHEFNSDPFKYRFPGGESFRSDPRHGPKP